MHIVSISGFAEVDKVFGRQPKFTRADFVPIARFTEGPMVLLVNEQMPYKSLPELVDDAKKRPNQIIFSSSGLYGALHLPTALFAKAAGIEMRHLPTNGGGPALTALLGNNAQVLVSSLAAANAHIKAGKARALGVFLEQTRPIATRGADPRRNWASTSSSRSGSACLPPRGTPEAIIAKLREVSKKAAATEQFAKAIDNIGDVLAYQDQPEFAKFWDEDARRVEDAVRSIGKV